MSQVNVGLFSTENATTPVKFQENLNTTRNHYLAVRVCPEMKLAEAIVDTSR